MDGLMMERSEAEKKVKTRIETGEQRRQRELQDSLREKGMLKTENGKLVVDISKSNKEYFRDAWKTYWKENAISFEDFYRSYMSYRPEGKLAKPKEYVGLVYLKDIKFSVTYSKVGGEGELPIYMDPLRSGEPSLKAGYGRRREIFGEKEYNVEAGMSYDFDEEKEEKRTKPYVKVEKAGIFAKFLNGVKEIQAGIGEGMFNLFAEIKEKTQYFFSAVVGPWIGKVDVASGKTGGGFSWIMAGFEEFKRVVGRLFAEDKFLGVSFESEITEGKTVKGKIGGKDVEWKVSKITERVAESEDTPKAVYFKDETGKRYSAKFNGSVWEVSEYSGPARRIGKAFHPGALVEDAAEIAVIGPAKTLQDNLYYRFKTGDTIAKLDEGRKSGYSQQMIDAYDRGNMHTARHYAKTLVNSSTGIEKAEHMLNLDKIEWAVGYRGFFLGHISGMGFGNKKTMVNKEIERRVMESIDTLKKEPVGSGKFKIAYEYIRGKAEFTYARDGSLIPKSPYPERLKKPIMDAVLIAEKRIEEEMGQIGLEKKGATKIEAINFNDVKIRENAPNRKDIARFLGFLQRAYENVDGSQEQLQSWHGIFKSEQLTNGASLEAFYTGFVKNVGNSEFLANVDSLSKEELERTYKKGMRKSNPRPRP